MTITAEDLVRREVHYCISFLVSTLAGGDYPHGADDLGGLMDAAVELVSPILDYEEAATEAGWEDVTDTTKFPPNSQFRDSTDGQSWACSGWQELCEEFDIEPHEWEVFEHWIVSDWLADRLAEHGEKVDKDFAGLTVWARTCTGQGVASDSVIEKITAELNAAR
ncbi:hypothetical protein [Pleomorphomonas sp. PLEO]|uniref:hypothetical protein n=1 Tax=Pleomorphomonas sp. PLEO TaxID=3239306 RepID=UPI00351F658A